MGDFEQQGDIESFLVTLITILRTLYRKEQCHHAKIQKTEPTHVPGPDS